MIGVPTVADCRSWAQLSATSVSDVDLEQIRAAELDIQSRTCQIPADPDADGNEATYPAALARALLRRTQRQVAARPLPLGFVDSGGSEYGPVQLAAFDAEVSRLESSYRLHVVA